MTSLVGDVHLSAFGLSSLEPVDTHESTNELSIEATTLLDASGVGMMYKWVSVSLVASGTLHMSANVKTFNAKQSRFISILPQLSPFGSGLFPFFFFYYRFLYGL